MTECMGSVARGIGWRVDQPSVCPAGPCRAVGGERMWILPVSIRLAGGALHCLWTCDPHLC